MVRDGSNAANVVYIDNVADAILFCLGNESTIGGTYILNDPLPATWRQWMEGYSRILGDQVSPQPLLTTNRFRLSLTKWFEIIRHLFSVPRLLLRLLAISANSKEGKKMMKRSAAVTYVFDFLARFRSRAEIKGKISAASYSDWSNPVKLPKHRRIPPADLITTMQCPALSAKKELEGLGFVPSITFETAVERIASWFNEAGVREKLEAEHTGE